MTPADIARAFHCSPGVIVHIARHHPDLLDELYELGPMRIYWSHDWGWILNNVPVYMRSDLWSGQMIFLPTKFNRNGGKQSKVFSREGRTEPT